MDRRRCGACRSTPSSASATPPPAAPIRRGHRPDRRPSSARISRPGVARQLDVTSVHGVAPLAGGPRGGRHRGAAGGGDDRHGPGRRPRAPPGGGVAGNPGPGDHPPAGAGTERGQRLPDHGHARRPLAVGQPAKAFPGIGTAACDVPHHPRPGRPSRPAGHPARPVSGDRRSHRLRPRANPASGRWPRLPDRSSGASDRRRARPGGVVPADPQRSAARYLLDPAVLDGSLQALLALVAGDARVTAMGAVSVAFRAHPAAAARDGAGPGQPACSPYRSALGLRRHRTRRFRRGNRGGAARLLVRRHAPAEFAGLRPDVLDRLCAQHPPAGRRTARSHRPGDRRRQRDRGYAGEHVAGGCLCDGHRPRGPAGIDPGRPAAGIRRGFAISRDHPSLAPGRRFGDPGAGGLAADAIHRPAGRRRDLAFADVRLRRERRRMRSARDARPGVGRRRHRRAAAFARPAGPGPVCVNLGQGGHGSAAAWFGLGPVMATWPAGQCLRVAVVGALHAGLLHQVLERIEGCGVKLRLVALGADPGALSGIQDVLAQTPARPRSSGRPCPMRRGTVSTSCSISTA